MSTKHTVVYIKSILFFMSFFVTHTVFADPTTDFGASSILLTLSNNVVILIWFVSITAYVMAIVFMFAAIMKVKHERDKGGSGGANYGGAFSYFLLAIVLANIPGLLDIISVTYFEKTPFQDIGQKAANSDSSLTNCIMYVALSLILKLIGLIAAIRGAVIVSKATQQPGGSSGDNKLSKGFIHFFGGVACINFFTLLIVFQNTFGFQPIDSANGIASSCSKWIF